jgi:hypothetical protein
MSTIIQSNKAYPATTCAFSSNVTAGSVLIVVSAGNDNEASTTLSDTLGNTYTRDSGGWNNIDGVAIWHTVSASGGANTVTRSSGSDVGLIIMEVSGLDTSALVNTTDFANTVGTGTVPTSNSYTTTQTCFIISAYNEEHSGNSATAGTGYTIVQENGAQHSVAQVKSGVSSGTYTNTFSIASSISSWVMATVAYKETGGSTPVYNGGFIAHFI